jgi:hypothetical protein
MILGPILCGALFFFVKAGGQQPGVYLETSKGIFELSEYSTGTAPPFAGAVRRVSVPPDPSVLSFFVVGPPSFPLAAHAQSAALYFFVVDDSDESFQSAYLPLRISVRRVNPRVYHITSEDLQARAQNELGGRYLREVLGRTARSRGNLQLLAGLALPESSNGLLRLYPVRFGPR